MKEKEESFLISRKVENAGHTCYKCRQLIRNESMIKSKHLGVFWSFDQVFIWWKFCITGAEIHFTFTSSFFFGFQRWVEHSSCSSRCEPKDFQSLRLLLPWSIWRHGTRWNWQKSHLKYFIKKNSGGGPCRGCRCRRSDHLGLFLLAPSGALVVIMV